MRTWRDTCLVCCFLPLACGSVRHGGLVAAHLAPLLAEHLADLWPRLRQQDDDRPSVGAAISVIGLLAALVLSLPWLEITTPSSGGRAGRHRVESDLQAVADWIADAPNVRIFTRFSWGEYLG